MARRIENKEQNVDQQLTLDQLAAVSGGGTVNPHPSNNNRSDPYKSFKFRVS